MRQVLEDWGLTRNEDRSTSVGPLDIPGLVGASALEMDHRLGSMGRSILARRPSIYASWIRHRVRLGVAKLLAERWVSWPLVLLVATIPYLLLRARRRPQPVTRDSTGALAVTALSFISVGFFIAHLGVVVLVHYPKDRYATAMAFLVPSLLVAALFELWRWVLAAPSER